MPSRLYMSSLTFQLTHKLTGDLFSQQLPMYNGYVKNVTYTVKMPIQKRGECDKLSSS